MCFIVKFTISLKKLRNDGQQEVVAYYDTTIQLLRNTLVTKKRKHNEKYNIYINVIKKYNVSKIKQYRNCNYVKFIYLHKVLF